MPLCLGASRSVRHSAMQTTATLAAAEGNASWDPAMATVRAERAGEGWTLTGTKSFVIDGATADLVLVVARSTAGLRCSRCTAPQPFSPFWSATF
jgi:alkylation response protein AidB-like acyl-CoA dehydrogenase